MEIMKRNDKREKQNSVMMQVKEKVNNESEQITWTDNWKIIKTREEDRETNIGTHEENISL